MKATEFCYWLQGFFEITQVSHLRPDHLNEKQVEMIKNHLSLVFKHDIDPKTGPPEYQFELQNIHDGIARC